MSKTITIEVVNVSAPAFVKTTKGGYNVIEVANKQDGKIGGKRLLDYASPTVYNTFLAAQPGTVFTVEIEKNEKGFWDWVTATPGTAATTQTTTSQAAPAVTSPAPAPAGRGRVTGSTYETPQERAVNRAAIIKQSSINQAREHLGPDAPVASILEEAQAYEDAVYTGLAERAKQLFTMAKDMKGTE